MALKEYKTHILLNIEFAKELLLTPKRSPKHKPKGPGWPIPFRKSVTLFRQIIVFNIIR